MYHIVTREGRRLARERVGRNRKQAERRLRSVELEIDQGTLRAARECAFSEWADRWLEGLRREETTRRTYRASLEYAKQVIGRKPIRKVSTSDVCAFLDHIEQVNRSRERPRDVSPTTLAKHLRHLGACLQAARAESLIAENPVRLLTPSARPKVKKKRPSYFTNDELPRLWPELVDRPTISHVCRLAVATGMRMGELTALRWDDVNLLNEEIVVSHTYAAGFGEAPRRAASHGRSI
jgi:integrase